MKIFEWKQATQLGPLGIALAFFIPSGVAFFGFHLVMPRVIEAGMPSLLAWPITASLMFCLLIPVAISLLSREAKALGIPFRARLCLKKPSRKEWGITGAFFAAIMLLSGLSQGLVEPLLELFDFKIPDYMPFFLNPTIDPLRTNPALLSPGLVLKGNFPFLALFAATLLLNIITEELYFRAWIMPKLERYGKASWIINGTLFALYHSFQLWLLPTLLVASLGVALVIRLTRSIVPAMAIHFAANFLLSILGLLLLFLR